MYFSIQFCVVKSRDSFEKKSKMCCNKRIKRNIKHWHKKVLSILLCDPFSFEVFAALLQDSYRVLYTEAFVSSMKNISLPPTRF